MTDTPTRLNWRRMLGLVWLAVFIGTALASIGALTQDSFVWFFRFLCVCLSVGVILPATCFLARGIWGATK